MASIRIHLIEDNRILREGITDIINEHEDLQLAGVSYISDNPVSKTLEVKPNIVLMDLSLSNQKRLDLLQSVKITLPEIKIIGMGLATVQTDILNFILAGANGFILKNSSMKEVLKTIRAVAGGETVFPSSMAGALFNQIIDYSLLKGKINFPDGFTKHHGKKKLLLYW